MGTQDVSIFQEPIRAKEDILSSWLDLDDSYTPIFQQELQDLENYFFHFENDPIYSSSLPIPAADEESSFMLDLAEESSFMLDLYNFNADQQPGPEQNDQAYQPIFPVLPVEQKCVKAPDVCDTFLNDYDFGLLSPTDVSPDINNIINDQFHDYTTISGFMNQLGDADMPEEPMVNTANATSDSNKTTDDEDTKEGTNEEGNNEDCPKPGIPKGKKTVSERNRRNRLNQQLLSLRSILPNITKMDKRSVLVDAHSYLRSIQEETEKLQKEIEEQQPRPKLSDLTESSEDNPSGTLHIPCTSTSVLLPKPIAQITEIDTEIIEDKRFVVKITCKGGNGVGSDILRVFESLNFEITCTALERLQPQEFLLTVIVRVRKQGKMTEQKLKDCITSMALRTGLSLQNP